MGSLSFIEKRARKTRRQFSSAARASFFIANVRASLRAAFRSAITLSRRITRASDIAIGQTQKFAYTFDHIAEIMNHFTEALGLSHYSLYMQDYGGPVGFRMILAHPERVEALDRSGRRRAQRLAWARIGRRGVRTGPIARQTKARCVTNLALARDHARASRRRRSQRRAATTRISGPMNIIFSTSQDKRTFKAISSTTTAPMLRIIPSGKPGCARNNRACW